jgi:hypothetical protein
MKDTAKTVNVTTIEELSECEDFACANGVGEDRISQAERELGLSFAPEYRVYLKLYGFASVKGLEFTGICASQRLNVVAVTKKLREENAALARDMYVIEDAGLEGVFVLQDEAGRVYELQANGAIKQIAESMIEYIIHE